MNTIQSSIADKLQMQARARGMDTTSLCTRWAADGFLARLSLLPEADRTVVKGATLFVLWAGDILRGTKDVDLHLRHTQAEDIPDLMWRVLIAETEMQDNIEFALGSVRFRPLMGNTQGVGMSVDASIGRTRVKLRVDAECGAFVWSEPETLWYPRLLSGFEPFQIQAYPQAALIAEKLATIVEFGPDNTRLRDFYDLWFLTQHFYFLGHVLLATVQTAFHQRGVYKVLRSQPDYWRSAFSPSFVSGERVRIWKQWGTAHLSESSLPPLHEVIGRVAEFGLPLLEAARDEQPFKKRWCPGREWKQLVPDQSPPKSPRLRPRTR